jgi:hypothetical protein
MSDAPSLAEQNKALWEALEECVKLQAHYAELLNMWDGGKRHAFKNADEFVQRMIELRMK